MAHKLDAKKVIDAMKAAVKDSKKVLPPKTPFNPVVKSGPRERDMRQEAKDMGAHGSQEYFGVSDK